MWDDIIIGKGKQPHICSAYKCYEGSESELNISENQNSYWISGLILGGSIKIYKDCAVGTKLIEMLSKPDEKKITKYLNKMFLARCNSQTLLTIIEDRLNESYEKGKEMKADEIRRTLGISGY